MTDEEGYAFVLRHLLRSNENTLLFFLLLKYFMMLKSTTLITLVYYYIIFDLNISTSPCFSRKTRQLLKKKLILLQARYSNFNLRIIFILVLELRLTISTS